MQQSAGAGLRGPQMPRLRAVWCWCYCSARRQVWVMRAADAKSCQATIGTGLRHEKWTIDSQDSGRWLPDSP